MRWMLEIYIAHDANFFVALCYLFSIFLFFLLKIWEEEGGKGRGERDISIK